ncbi:hypothetical protein ACYJ1Y_13755 [Natrialbaceae archaeon A-gly3]
MPMMTDVTERRHGSTDDQDADRDDSHLDDVEVGAGCTEIWEHLAEKREE